MSPPRAVVVVAILLAMFMAAMEATVVGTVMPTVVAELKGLELYGWVAAIYMLATTVTIPIYGKLADTLGRKPVMLTGIALFLAGSVASGLAPTMKLLVAARALQGIGAGGMQPIALTIVGDMYRPAERARLQGLFGAVWGVAAISGPLLGGLIVRALSWRWVFFVNVPLGALASALLVWAYREPAREASRSAVDALGAAALTVTIVSLLAAVEGRMVALSAPSFALALLLFVWTESRHPSPMLPLSLLRRRLIATSSGAGVVVGGVMTASVLFAPLYVQAILGGTPTDGGTAVAPMLVGWPIASALSGRILLKTGPRPLVRTGFAFVALAAVALDRVVDAHAGINALRLVMLLFGTGMGLANTALVISVQESVTFRERGVATATTMFFRTIGGAVLAGALGAVLARAVAGRVPEEVLDAILGPEHGRSLAHDALVRYDAALHDGLRPVFHVIAALGVVGALLGLVFPEVRLSGTRASEGGETPVAQSSKSTTTGA